MHGIHASDATGAESDRRRPPSATGWPGGEVRAFASRTAIVAGAVALLWLAWYLKQVIALAFAGIVVAVLIDTAARPLRRWTPLGKTGSSALTVVLLLAVLGLGAWAVFPKVQDQGQTLIEALPVSLQEIEKQFGGMLEGASGTLADTVKGLLSWSISAAYAATSLILVIMLGAFLAIHPDRYRDGVVRLFPKPSQDEIRRALTRTGHVLHAWLLGKLLSMAIIGTGVGLGTWWLGLPAPFMLGAIAGLLAFVPIVGPILAALPGIVLALSMGTTTALWTVLLYVGIEQLESNLILPMVEGKAAGLPPALLIIAFAAMGTLFGLLGAIIAAPLAVALYSLVKLLYLGEDPRGD